MQSQTSTTDRICAQCGAPFTVRFPSHKQRNCSPACASKAQSERSNRHIDRPCATCGKAVSRPPSRTNGRANVFCDLTCYGLYQQRHPHGPETAAPAQPAITKTCTVCGATFRTPIRRRDREHCSAACRHAAHSVIRNCVGCGVTFTVGLREANQHYCSMQCKSSRMTMVNCERCGKAFRMGKGDRRHCSEECRRPPHSLTCLTCGTSFHARPCDLRGTRRFCSVKCYKAHNGETLPEQNVRLALTQIGVTFLQEHSLSVVPRPVDFFLPDSDIAIEVDSAYWHAQTAERDQRKDSRLCEQGIRVVRLDGDVLLSRDVTDEMVEYVRCAIRPLLECRESA